MTSTLTLRQKVLRGIRWRGFADMAQMVLQIAFTAVLARLLGLADFGLVAMCLLFLRFVSALTKVGFGAAVIQSQTITPGQISGIFVIQLGIKIGALGATVLAAPLAARFFEQPQLTEMIRILAIVILLEGLSFPQVLARKELRFRGYSLVELGSLVAANVLGIALAITGFGVWSLIARYIAEKAIYAAAIWPVIGWYPARPTFRGLAPHLRFGFTLFASSIVYFFSQHFAAVIIGKFVGVSELGLYNVAYNLGLLPGQKVQSAFSTVLLPAFAALQRDLKRMSEAVRDAFFRVGALFIPITVGLAATAPSFVITVYGAKWAKAGDYLVVLALVGLFKGIEHLLRAVLIASAKGRRILYVTVIEAAIAVPVLWLAGRHIGVWGIVLAFLLISMLAALLTGVYVQLCLESTSVLRRAFGRSFLAAALMFAGVFPIPFVLALPAYEALAVQVAGGALLYTVVRWCMLTQEERRVVSKWPLFRRILAPS